MAHSKAVQQKFVELRGQGLSFSKISEEIGVSKPTLMKWQKEMWDEIRTEEAVEYQRLLELHRVSKRHKIEAHSTLLSKVLTEIGTRDLSNESVRDLLALKGSCEESLKRDLQGTEFLWQESVSMFTDMDQRTVSTRLSVE